MNGELTADFLDQFLATVLAKGSADKVIYTGTIGAYYISRFNRSGQGAFWKPANEKVHGVKVDGFISGVFGTLDPGDREEGVVELPLRRRRLQRQPLRGRHLEHRAAAAPRPRHEAADLDGRTPARTAWPRST